jgi:hypothetical protein
MRPNTTEDLQDYLLNVDLDIDIWSRGRDAAAAGRLTDRMLKACYPFVEIEHKDTLKWNRVLKEHFEQNDNFQWPFLIRSSAVTIENYVFFQNREDRDLFDGLRYLY